MGGAGRIFGCWRLEVGGLRFEAESVDVYCLKPKAKQSSNRAQRLLLHLAFLIPLGAGIFHVGHILFHALMALHFEIGYVPVLLLHFGSVKHLGAAAATLGAGRIDRILFLSHTIPPVSQ